MPSDRPAISVVVPSHARPARLRRLLDALAAQTLPRDAWEAIVVHDYAGDELVAGHPLARAGVARQIRIAPGTGAPARQRNLGWRAARAPRIAFTDDDCRPAPDWLERLLAEAGRHDGAIVQGAVRPDPDEAHLLAAPHARSLHVDPPGPFAQTANILYPRAVLEAVGGFDETFPGPAGEDLDLALRARRATGAGYVGAPAALVFHAVETYTLREMVRLNGKWREMPLVVKRHPHLRRRLVLGVFWRGTHFRLTLALAGLAAARRRRGFALLAAPYLYFALNARGGGAAAWAAAGRELPGRVVIDGAEVATLAWGSARHRALVL